MSQSQYRNKNQDFISNFVFQFIKKTKWHFGYTDSLRLARVVKTQAFKTTKSIKNLKNGK